MFALVGMAEDVLSIIFLLKDCGEPSNMRRSTLRITKPFPSLFKILRSTFDFTIMNGYTNLWSIKLLLTSITVSSLLSPYLGESVFFSWGKEDRFSRGSSEA
jgi:hypothetical protein